MPSAADMVGADDFAADPELPKTANRMDRLLPQDGGLA
jgi:hypothetical protein